MTTHICCNLNWLHSNIIIFINLYPYPQPLKKEFLLPYLVLEIIPYKELNFLVCGKSQSRH
jgi:hypothetical protein